MTPSSTTTLKSLRKISDGKGIPIRLRGNSWTVDFETIVDHRTSLVFLLSTGARGAVHRITDHVLAGCVDLNHLKETQSNLAFVSLFDDTADVWRPEDFGLVEEYSQIARWSYPDELERILLTPA